MRLLRGGLAQRRGGPKGPAGPSVVRRRPRPGPWSGWTLVAEDDHYDQLQGRGCYVLSWDDGHITVTRDDLDELDHPASPSLLEIHLVARDFGLNPYTAHQLTGSIWMVEPT